MRSCVLPYTSQIAVDTPFFRFLYLEYDFMIANLVRLNLTVPKLVKLQAFIPKFNLFHPGCYYYITPMNLNLFIMSQRGNHLSALHDKIPVFYALEYPEFTTITFYLEVQRPNLLLTLSICTNSSWLHAHFNDILTQVTITTKI